MLRLVKWRSDVAWQVPQLYQRIGLRMFKGTSTGNHVFYLVFTLFLHVFTCFDHQLSSNLSVNQSNACTSDCWAKDRWGLASTGPKLLLGLAPLVLRPLGWKRQKRLSFLGGQYRGFE